MKLGTSSKNQVLISHGQPNSSYFNDDMALYGPLCPEDVLDDGVFVRFPTSEVELGCNNSKSFIFAVLIAIFSPLLRPNIWLKSHGLFSKLLNFARWVANFGLFS